MIGGWGYAIIKVQVLFVRFDCSKGGGVYKLSLGAKHPVSMTGVMGRVG